MRIGDRVCCPRINISWDSRLSSQGEGQRTNIERYFIDISLKPIFTRVATWVFCGEIVKSAEVCSEYLSSNMKITAIGMVGTNIFLGSMLPISQNAFRVFVNSCINSSNDFNTYIYPLVYLLIIIACIIRAHAYNATYCMKLRNDLAYEMRDKLIESWLAVGAKEKYTQTMVGPKIEDPVYDLSFMSTNLCEYLINLINARISTLSLFIGALHSMYLNSGFIQLSFLGVTIEFPHMILICFLYVYGFGHLSSGANPIFKKYNLDKNDAMNILKPNEEYQKNNKHIHDIDEDFLLPQSRLSSLNRANTELSVVIGAIALLLSGNIFESIIIMYMAQNFSYAAVQAAWHRMQLDSIKKLEGAYERVQNILAVIHELREPKEFSVLIEA